MTAVDLRHAKSATELEHGLAARSFKWFVKVAWTQIDPAPLVWNWHVEAICDHLQAVTEGKIKRLVINIPPGHAKSMLVSVLWPAWVWAKRPQWRALFASYELGLVTRDAVKCRDLMRSEWYTKWFRGKDAPFECCPSWEFQDDQDQKTYYSNSRGGFRVALSVGGKGTGYRGDALVIDDPLKADDAHSKLARDSVIRWKTETMASRFNDPAGAQQVLIMQRLHEDDLSGYLLKQGGWQHLCLASEFETDRRSTTYEQRKHGRKLWSDPRTYDGELLFPQKFTREVLDELKSGRGMGSYAYAGQHQQRPVPAEGGLLKRAWFNRRWILPGEQPVEGLECRVIPTQFDGYSVFVDAAFKKTDDSDRVAIGVFGTKGADQYLLELQWRQMGFVDTVRALLDVRSRWTRVSGVYIEDKANGSAIIDTLKGKVPGVIPIEPDGGKEARIAAAGPFIEAGNLWLPQSAPWLEDFISEAAAFPKAPHDDAIDMTAYALLRLCGRTGFGNLEALGTL
jgi:predicted phage terminase large subunit-like protein